MKKENLIKMYQNVFDSEQEPEIFFAPGRVNLIGEHTDYNGGHVFPCALTFGTYGLARKRSDPTLNFYSYNFESDGIISSSLDELAHSDNESWTSYPQGVIWAFQKYGYKLDCGMDLFFYGDIPNGSGLSSSASIEVLMGTILRDLYHFDEISMTKIALLGQYSENNFNGMNCGIMDQFASAMGKEGHAIFLDTDTLDYEYVPVELGNIQLIITNSNVKHSLVSSAYNERRQECEKGLSTLQRTIQINSLGDINGNQLETFGKLIKDEVIRKRVHHAVYENQRTIEAVSALKENDLISFGRLMNESHISLRDDYEVSCPEIDVLVETAWSQSGVLGSRMTGGGFGGCTISLVEASHVESFMDSLRTTYVTSFAKEPEFYVAQIGDGARRL